MVRDPRCMWWRAALLAFLVAAPVIAQENTAAGAALFDGRTRLANGGAQCMACHGVSSIAAPGGGTLGPDLTGAVRKYGGTERMIAVLAAIPFPTMVPVYRDHPLTPAEQAELTAYIGSASGAPAAATVFAASLGIWLGAGLFMIAYAIWRNRLGRVRASLEEE